MKFKVGSYFLIDTTIFYKLWTLQGFSCIRHLISSFLMAFNDESGESLLFVIPFKLIKQRIFVKFHAIVSSYVMHFSRLFVILLNAIVKAYDKLTRLIIETTPSLHYSPSIRLLFHRQQLSYYCPFTDLHCLNILSNMKIPDVECFPKSDLQSSNLLHTAAHCSPVNAIDHAARRLTHFLSTFFAPSMGKQGVKMMTGTLLCTMSRSRMWGLPTGSCGHRLRAAPQGTHAKAKDRSARSVIERWR